MYCYQRNCKLCLVGSNRYPERSLLMNCEGSELKYVETLAKNRTAWRYKVATLYHWTHWVHYEHDDAV